MTQNHKQYYHFCHVTYWNGTVAASEGDEWTVCNVAPIGLYTSGEQSFDNSESGIYARDRLLRFLEKAYERGRYDAKKEIREVLGVKEQRP